MPCSFINFPSGFLSVSTSVTAIVAGDLRLKMTCETTWGKHRPVTTTSDPTQHLSGYVPSCARRQKWPIQCSQQSLWKLEAQANSKPNKSQQNPKKMQVKVRWTVNTGSMIYGTAAFFIFPCSAVKQLAIPLSGKCCQRSDSGRGIHQTDLEPASWKPPGVQTFSPTTWGRQKQTMRVTAYWQSLANCSQYWSKVQWITSTFPPQSPQMV